MSCRTCHHTLYSDRPSDCASTAARLQEAHWCHSSLGQTFKHTYSTPHQIHIMSEQLSNRNACLYRGRTSSFVMCLSSETSHYLCQAPGCGVWCCTWGLDVECIRGQGDVGLDLTQRGLPLLAQAHTVLIHHHPRAVIQQAQRPHTPLLHLDKEQQQHTQQQHSQSANQTSLARVCTYPYLISALWYLLWHDMMWSLLHLISSSLNENCAGNKLTKVEDITCTFTALHNTLFKWHIISYNYGYTFEIAMYLELITYLKCCTGLYRVDKYIGQSVTFFFLSPERLDHNLASICAWD